MSSKFIRIPYSPQPHQLQWHNNPTRFLVAVCGRQIGKTTAAVNELVKRAITHKGTRNWYVTNDYGQAKRNVWDEIKRYIVPEMGAKFNASDLTIHFPNGSKIELIGVENAESLRGAVVHFMVLDEFADFPPHVWPKVLRPMFSTTEGDAWFLGTPKGYNHFYELYEMQREDYTRYSVPSCVIEDGRVISTTSKYASVSEIQSAKDTTSDDSFAQEYLGAFTRRTGTIWSKFRRDIHPVPRRAFQPSLTHVGSIDFGFATGHPTSFSVHEWNNQGEVYTGDNFIQEGLGIDEIDELMRSKTAGLTINAVYYDVARPDLAEGLRKKGWRMIPASKDVELGIAKVDEFMAINPLTGKPRWTIADHLAESIRQIEGYVWQEIRNEDNTYKNVPVKRNDDFCDELRYCLYSHTKPVDDGLDTKVARMMQERRNSDDFL